MNVGLFLTAIATMSALAMIMATMLIVASRWFHVFEDPRIERVEEMLPHTNCGACGYPGCHAFAEALVAGAVQPAKCSVSAPAAHTQIADFLGVQVGDQQRQVARLACAGGNNVARHRARYRGLKSCAAAAVVAGGGKACFWGCIGYGDCESACDFDAIEMDEHELPVVDELRCTACGDCVRACPKDLFSLHNVSDRLWVACSSLAHGDELLQDCEVACTGCSRCAMDAPDLIEMKDNLPLVHYDRGGLNAEPTQRCPTGAIVWIDPQDGIVKGSAARKIIRQDERRDAAT